MTRSRSLLLAALLIGGLAGVSAPAFAASTDNEQDGNLYEPDPYASAPETSEPAYEEEAPAYEPPSDDYSAPSEEAYQPPKKKKYVAPAPTYDDDAYQPPAQTYDSAPPPYVAEDDTFSPDEIKGAGHRFFGRITENLASVIEYAFQQGGRPNGYILGEEGGGAFIAGLRYGEGTLVTRNAGQHKVFWQGPSIGYDFGAEGSKTMILVYNLQSPSDIFATFGGVDGSVYVVGGVGLTFLANEHVTLAPIRSGIGLRLGANIGYLKYTQAPTWNPF